MYAYAYVQKQDEDIKYPPLLLTAYYFEAGSLPESGPIFSQLDWKPGSSTVLLSLPPQIWGCRHTKDAGIQTTVLMIAWLASGLNC